MSIDPEPTPHPSQKEDENHPRYTTDPKSILLHTIPKDIFIATYATRSSAPERQQENDEILVDVAKNKGKPDTIEHFDMGQDWHYLIYYDLDGTGQAFFSWKTPGDERMHLGVARHLQLQGIGLRLCKEAYDRGCHYAPLRTLSPEQAGLYHKFKVMQAAREDDYIETDVLKDYPEAIDEMPPEKQEEARDRLIDIGVLPPKEEPAEGGGGVVIRSEDSDELL